MYIGLVLKAFLIDPLGSIDRNTQTCGVCCSVLQRGAACWSVLPRVAACCSVLQVLQVLQCDAVCYSVLQCVAVYCSEGPF